MAVKLRVYAATSVFSACFGDRAADRKSLTRGFWQNLAAYDCSTSELAVEDLRQTADWQLRAQMESLLPGFQITPVTDEMRTLAENVVLAPHPGSATIGTRTKMGMIAWTISPPSGPANARRTASTRRRRVELARESNTKTPPS